MDIQPNLYAEILKMVPIILGGVLAISGGMAGQWVTHRLSARREKKTLLSSRLETLVKALYGQTQWLEDKYNAMIFRDEDHNSPSPLDEARMLQSLYFPEMGPEIVAIMKAQIPMVKFMWTQRIARMKDDATWLKEVDMAPYHQAYEAYLEAINAATNKCSTLVQSHLSTS